MTAPRGAAKFTFQCGQTVHTKAVCQAVQRDRSRLGSFVLDLLGIRSIVVCPYFSFSSTTRNDVNKLLRRIGRRARNRGRGNQGGLPCTGIEERWGIACQIYGDLPVIRKNLRTIFHVLEFSYITLLLETRAILGACLLRLSSNEDS